MIHQHYNDRIELQAPGDARTTVYRYAPTLPKACIHPLVTPRGHVISGFEMSDHVWHRGLWFSIKYLNKHNFWEEKDDDFGLHLNKREPGVELPDENTVRLSHDVEWTSKTTGKTFDETRVLIFRTHGTSGVRSIDWFTDLTAARDLELDRTPYTTWGGYGGLSLRATRGLHKSTFLLPGGKTREKLAGQAHDWIVMQGLMDGGPNQHVSIGMIDHPGNPRAAVPFYAKALGVNFMNAAFLFHEPMTVQQGDTLRFRYRVCYRDGLWTADEFAQLADAFRKEDIQ